MRCNLYKIYLSLIRYNISTTDYDGQTTDASLNNRVRRRRFPGVKIWEKYG